jgi:hypothetical protein
LAGLVSRYEVVRNGMDDTAKLLAEGLDLCVRARKMDAMDRRKAALGVVKDQDGWVESGMFDRHVERHNIEYPRPANSPAKRNGLSLDGRPVRERFSLLGATRSGSSAFTARKLPLKRRSEIRLPLCVLVDNDADVLALAFGASKERNEIGVHCPVIRPELVAELQEIEHRVMAACRTMAMN